MKGINRRTVLRGMLGASAVSVGLPCFEFLLNENGTAYADGTGFPRRFGLWFWGNGVWAEGVWRADGNGGEVPVGWDWNPTDTGPGYTLPEQFAGLQRHRDIMTLISGTDVKTGSRFPHNSGACGVLTGASPVGTEDSDLVWPLPTIDQVIAAQIGQNSTFSSLETSAIRGSYSVSYKGPNTRNPSEDSPHRLFELIFGARFRLPGEGGVDADEIGLRRSVLDAVLEQTQRLRRNVGTADRRRLESHLQGIRDLERRLARTLEDPPSFDACMRPEAPPMELPDDERGRQDIAQRNELMAELLAMSFACDQTRVFSHLFTKPVGNARLPLDGLELNGAVEGHHTLTHDEPRFDNSERPLRRVYSVMQWYFEQLAVFVDKFRDIEEGDSTLLDNMVLLGTTDTSNPRGHWVTNFPVFYFGSACGRLRTGEHLRSVGENTSRIGLTLARAFSPTIASFGAGAGEVTDGLSMLDAPVTP